MPLTSPLAQARIWGNSRRGSRDHPRIPFSLFFSLFSLLFSLLRFFRSFPCFSFTSRSNSSASTISESPNEALRSVGGCTPGFETCNPLVPPHLTSLVLVVPRPATSRRGPDSLLLVVAGKWLIRRTPRSIRRCYAHWQGWHIACCSCLRSLRLLPVRVVLVFRQRFLEIRRFDAII